jgi:hypothetical protein
LPVTTQVQTGDDAGAEFIVGEEAMSARRHTIAAWAFLGLLFFGASVQPLRAQEPVARDSVDIAGASDGRTAADQRRLEHRSILAFTGALPMGIFTPFIFSSGRAENPGLLGVILAGGALVIVAGRAGASTLSPPAELQRTIESRDPRYQTAFRTAYRTRLEHRITGQVVRGAVLGFGSGLLLLLPVGLLLSGYD